MRGCTILRNGSSGLYEHGIYASSEATGYMIEKNLIADSGATDVKASGSGTIRANELGSTRIAIYVSDSAGRGAGVSNNLIRGRFLHVIFVASTGKARIRENTILSEGTSSESRALFLQDGAETRIGENTIGGG